MPYEIVTPQGLSQCLIYGEHVGREPQNYEEIQAECLNNNVLWQDPMFPANENSLGDILLKTLEEDLDKIVWKRPHEIVNDPRFITNGMTRFDVTQGRVGDCWILAALSDLTMKPEFLRVVVPDQQDFDEKYAGIFHFRFWVNGVWVDVPVDDRLPTINNKLLFVKSTTEAEFWTALIEKAYAKLHGTYSSIVGGFTSEALRTFTGGVARFLFLQNPNPVATLSTMFEAHSLEACMGAAILTDDLFKKVMMAIVGLYRSHAYSVTGIYMVEQEGVQRQIALIKLRNPWGRKEWRGDWSDNSPMWNTVSPETRNRLNLLVREDGEFFMSYKDFVYYFNLVEICYTHYPACTPGPQAVGNVQWEVDRLHSEWNFPHTAGGSKNHLDTYWKNPKVSFSVDELCEVTVALLQKNRRTVNGTNNLTIGFNIYKVDDRHVPLDQEYFEDHDSICSTNMMKFPENSHKETFYPGSYVVVPCTAEPHQEAEFLLRVMTNNSNADQNMENLASIEEYASTIPEISPARRERIEVAVHRQLALLADIETKKLKDLVRQL